MINVLLIDFHDSFTYNLAALLRMSANIRLKVLFPEEAKIEKISLFDKLIFSPGPGLPSEYPIIGEILDMYKTNKSIFGVCLGHQAICEYFGGKLINLGEVHHGRIKKLRIIKRDSLLYREIPDESSVGVYHSWCVDSAGFPSCFDVSAVSEDGIIMSSEHKHYDIMSVQFHPESFITGYGRLIMQNWLTKA
jgi:anthranilate synthase/aminodeoxychorismate synthase-like glutamine amidotransferase